MRINLSVLQALAHFLKTLAPVRRIVNELLVIQHLTDRIVEIVLFDKLVVIIERNREPVGNHDARQSRAHYLAKVRRLTAVGYDHLLSLLRQTEQALFGEIETRF